MKKAKPRKTPCASCPYRVNVPSGVWDANEYAKLPEYDGDTASQYPAAFFCHQADGSVCSGWLGHTDPSQLLGVRLGVARGTLDESCLDYSTDVPLFPSGAEAAAHGMAEYESPGERAAETIRKIKAKEESGG